MFCAYAAQVAYRPYMSPSDFEEVIREHMAASFTSPVHAKLRASIAGIESRGRKKARRNIMTPEGRVDRAAVLGLLSNWLFNYNTVELIMLFCAVIVSLMGVMFAALSVDPTNVYSSATDSVTGVVLAVIILSIIYFVFVLVSEIVILYSEASRERALKAAAARSAGKAKGAPGSRSPSSSSRSSTVFSREAAEQSSRVSGPVDQSLNPMVCICVCASMYVYMCVGVYATSTMNRGEACVYAVILHFINNANPRGEPTYRQRIISLHYDAPITCACVSRNARILISLNAAAFLLPRNRSSSPPTASRPLPP